MLAPDARAAVEGFCQAWETASHRKQERLRSTVPIAAMQQSAVDHEDPWVRRRCLGFLDHYAADTSAAVFVKALDDPVAPVRDIALHGLACERCRTEDLCVTDVTPKVARVLESDPNPEIRFKAITILRRLSSRDPAAVAAITQAAEQDGDERVRLAAIAILRGERPRRWNQFRRLATSRKAKASRRHEPPAAPK